MAESNVTLQSASLATFEAGIKALMLQEAVTGKKCPGGFLVFPTTIADDANVFQVVGAAAGLPVHQQTGATWAVSLASAPLPAGAATLAEQQSQTTLLTSIAGYLDTEIAAILTSAQILDDWDESDRCKTNPIVGQAGVTGGAGTVDAATQRVALATDANAAREATLEVSGTGVNTNDTPIAATDVTGYRSASVQITVANTGTVVFEESNNNSTWAATGFFTSTGGYYASITNGTGVFSCPIRCKYFRVRISSGGTGTCTAIAIFSAGNFASQFAITTAGSATGVGIVPLVNTAVDGVNGSSSSFHAGSSTLIWNGSAWERSRANVVATQLSSSARTATTNGSDQTNYNGRGVQVTLSVTAASGTGGLQVRIQSKDSISSAYSSLNAAPAAVTGTGTYVYVLYPSTLDAAAGDVTQVTQEVLPRTWRVSVTHSDGSSYTYSVSAVTIL